MRKRNVASVAASASSKDIENIALSYMIHLKDDLDANSDDIVLTANLGLDLRKWLPKFAPSSTPKDKADMKLLFKRIKQVWIDRDMVCFTDLSFSLSHTHSSKSPPTMK